MRGGSGSFASIHLPPILCSQRLASSYVTARRNLGGATSIVNAQIRVTRQVDPCLARGTCSIQSNPIHGWLTLGIRVAYDINL